MKTKNLFAEWKMGQTKGPKVYLIRIYYIDLKGEAKTCLKLGSTKQPLRRRISSFLSEMYKATWVTITKYEVLNVVHIKAKNKLEYALHHNGNGTGTRCFYNLTGDPCDVNS